MIYLNNIKIEQGHFPDNSLHLTISKDVFYIKNKKFYISWFYENDAELFTVICLKKWIDAHWTNPEVYLDMPYVCHARMDRVKSDEDVFTLKFFCQTINSLKFTKIFCFDTHSNVTSALLDRFTETLATPVIKNAIRRSNAEVLFFPDEGASKRYNGAFDMPSTFGVKNRDWATGRINSLILMNPEIVKGKRVLIVDDICSYGGTFVRAAKALREVGAAEVYLYVSHCEPNIEKGDIYKTSGLINKIYTTDTLLTEPLNNMEFVSRFRPSADCE